MNGARDGAHDAFAIDGLGPNDAGADGGAAVLFGALGRASDQAELGLRLERAEIGGRARDRGLGARDEHEHAKLGPEHGHATVFEVDAAFGEVRGDVGHQTGAVGAEGGEHEVAVVGHGATDSSTPAPAIGERMGPPPRTRPGGPKGGLSQARGRRARRRGGPAR